MKKRIFKWDDSRNRNYKKCPYNFNFVEGCSNGVVVWWNESLFCIDLDILKNLGEKK